MHVKQLLTCYSRSNLTITNNTQLQHSIYTYIFIYIYWYYTSCWLTVAALQDKAIFKRWHIYKMIVPERKLIITRNLSKWQRAIRTNDPTRNTRSTIPDRFWQWRLSDLSLMSPTGRETIIRQRRFIPLQDSLLQDNIRKSESIGNTIVDDKTIIVLKELSKSIVFDTIVTLRQVLKTRQATSDIGQSNANLRRSPINNMDKRVQQIKIDFMTIQRHWLIWEIQRETRTILLDDLPPFQPTLHLARPLSHQRYRYQLKYIGPKHFRGFTVELPSALHLRCHRHYKGLIPLPWSHSNNINSKNYTHNYGWLSSHSRIGFTDYYMETTKATFYTWNNWNKTTKTGQIYFISGRCKCHHANQRRLYVFWQQKRPPECPLLCPRQIPICRCRRIDTTIELTEMGFSCSTTGEVNKFLFESLEGSKSRDFEPIQLKMPQDLHFKPTIIPQWRIDLQRNSAQNSATV